MALYAVLSIGLMWTHRVGVTSEHVILLGLVVLSLIGRARPFVWDWLPFLFVAVMFEDLGSLAGAITADVHVRDPIAVDNWLLGGRVGSIWLQTLLTGPLVGSLIQPVLVVEYLCHFIAPLAMAGWLWRRHRQRFGTFVAAYTLVMSAGFAIYLLYPEMPPWLAAQHGDLPTVHRTVVEWLARLGDVANLYAGADPEPNAAMPSLHVAIPTVIALMILQVRGWQRRDLVWLAYPLTLAFGVVFLGEHYVADVVVGICLGAVAYALVARVGRPSKVCLPEPT